MQKLNVVKKLKTLARIKEMSRKAMLNQWKLSLIRRRKEETVKTKVIDQKIADEGVKTTSKDGEIEQMVPDSGSNLKDKGKLQKEGDKLCDKWLLL